MSDEQSTPETSEPSPPPAAAGPGSAAPPPPGEGPAPDAPMSVEPPAAAAPAPAPAEPAAAAKPSATVKPAPLAKPAAPAKPAAAAKPAPPKTPGLGSPTGAAQARRPATAKASTQPPELAEFMVRRRLFLNVGWASLAAFFSGMGVATARFFFPRTIFEPPTRFTAGFPSEFSVGEVNTNFQKSHRVWVVRDPDRIFAIYAKCTHLGCTPVWRETDNKFKCPCHGSGFTREGVNYEGPAPRPLERVKIVLAPDGQIVIDTAVKFMGERDEWGHDGAYLQV